MQLDPKVCAVLPFSFDMNAGALIQRIDQVLLDSLIFPVVQSVDLYCLPEDFFKLLPDFRKGNDRKASFFSDNVAVGDLSCLVVVPYLQLLLFFIEGEGIFVRLRAERFFSENLDHCRTGMGIRLFLMLLISHLHRSQPALYQILVQEQSRIFFVIVIKLFVWNRSGISCSQSSPVPVRPVNGAAVNDRLQSHLLKLKDRRAHHPLEAQMVADIDGLLL